MTHRHISFEECQDGAEWIAEKILLLGDHAQPHCLYGIPRGGVPVALLVATKLRDKGASVWLVEKPEDATIFVDDIIDSGNTKLRTLRKHGEKPFFTLYVKDPNETNWITFPWERMQNETGPEENVLRVLEFIGEDPEREGLQETPSRVVKSWERLFGGYGQDPAKVLKSFTDGACDEMVVLRNIEFYSHCEHHMMPFFGRAHIGYIPKGKVVGISKLARLLEVYTRRLQIQERIGQQVTEMMEQVLEPEGCGCILEAQHFCMTSRGVEKQNSVMLTSSMRGCFLDPSIKSEFLGFIRA